MAVYKLEDALCEVAVVAGSAVRAPVIEPLYDLVKEYKANVLGLTEIMLLERPATPLTFDLTITHVDGRIWRQAMVLASQLDTDPTITFNVSPGWRLSEILFTRPIREELLKLINTHYVTSVTVKYE